MIEYSDISEDEFPADYCYHVQIHFKRKIEGAPGSIEFDMSKHDLIEHVLKPYSGCLTIVLEERHIHPLNINRISICGTPRRLSEHFPNAVGNRSQKYDSLLQHSESTKNIAKKFLKEKPPCPISTHFSEGLNVHKWTILLIAAAVIVYFILNSFPDLGVNNEAISLVIGLVGAAIGLWKLKH